MTYDIGIKTRWGKYTSITKRFNNDKHFTNWYDSQRRIGNKVLCVNLSLND